MSGRAGRGERAGEAVIQTLFPTHYSIQLARTQDYRAFFDKETAFREAMRYPPHIAMVNVIVRGKAFEEAMAAATELANRRPRHGPEGLRGARAGAGAADQAARRAPRPVLPQGHEPRVDARGAALRAGGGAQPGAARLGGRRPDHDALTGGAARRRIASAAVDFRSLRERKRRLRGRQAAPLLPYAPQVRPEWLTVR